eukprot:1979-Heterococcus_DN1.PRE.1
MLPVATHDHVSADSRPVSSMNMSLCSADALRPPRTNMRLSTATALCPERGAGGLPFGCTLSHSSVLQSKQ